MDELAYLEVRGAAPLNDETYLVVCSHPNCRQWAVAYTTLEESPEPWPEVPYGGFCKGTHPEPPLWYVCQEHLTPKHRLLNIHMAPPVCERCGDTEGVAWVGGMTQYDESGTSTAWDYIAYGPAGKPSANRYCPYCPDCADMYRSFWEEQWKDYYANRL